MVDNLDSCGGGDPLTSVYCSINPVRFASDTGLAYLHQTQRTCHHLLLL